jgi:hypothetical protein
MKCGTPAKTILVLGLTLMLGAGIYAQVKKDAKTGLDRIEGSILSMNKDKSTLNVGQGGDTRVTWKVMYSDETKFTLNYKPSGRGDLRNGQRVTALGKFEKGVLKADRIDTLDVRVTR